ncbi:hypothetical protein GCM10027081_54250 [Cupriavidus yeoncheonensis]
MEASVETGALNGAICPSLVRARHPACSRNYAARIQHQQKSAYPTPMAVAAACMGPVGAKDAGLSL